MKLCDLAKEITEWSKANFGNTPVQNLNVLDDQGNILRTSRCHVEMNYLAPLLGMGEEVGEVCKQCKYTMATWDDEHEVIDGLADIGIYFADYLSRRQVSKERLEKTLFILPDNKHLCVSLSEHYGKLVHCELKRMQKIRGMDDLEAFEAAQAVAILRFREVLNRGAVAFTGQSIETLVERVFREKVSKRNWKANAATGGE